MIVLFATKTCKSLVVPILLHGCETSTLLTDTERKIQAFKMTLCGHNSCGTSGTFHNSEAVQAGLVRPRPGTTCCLKLSGRVCWRSWEIHRHCEGQKKSWVANVKEWIFFHADLFTTAQMASLINCCIYPVVPPGSK